MMTITTLDSIDEMRQGKRKVLGPGLLVVFGFGI